jgi:hypothetical protein
MSLFVVYELESESQPLGGPDATEQPVEFTPIPRGAYFATDDKTACAMAAKHHGRAGLFAALAATPHKLEFKADPVNDADVAKLTGKIIKARKKAAKARR